MESRLNSGIQSLYLPQAFLGLVLASTLACAAQAEPSSAAIPFAEIGAKATADYQGDALGISATADGVRLRCGFQKLEGRATPEGLWLESTATGDGGQLRLVAESVGRDLALVEASPFLWAGFDHLPTPSLEPGRSGASAERRHSPGTQFAALCRDAATGRLADSGTVEVADKLVRYIRPGVTEEYSVSVDGVRQDFVITERPIGDGDLRVELALAGARAEAMAYGAKLNLEGSDRTLAYSRLRATDATGRELKARMEVVAAPRQSAAVLDGEDGGGLPTDRYASLAVLVDDADAVYPVRIDPTFSDANWISMGGLLGANGYVRSAAVDGLGNLYIGGDFTVVGNVVVNHIARWNGSSWSALGTGLGSGTNDGVFALAMAGSDLYVGGRFTTAGGSAANSVAKWNGSSWSPLGSGLGNTSTATPEVFALAVSGGDLYAGGYFDTAGGSAANSIARWDGNNWSALGLGVNNHVLALAVSGSDLYAGGVFTKAGGGWANRIAKWNGSSWSALGSGMGGDHPSVCALAVSGSELYAGGWFTTAGGSTANHIAKWNGSSWSALGSGMDNSVYALAVSGSDLYAGGVFTTAGGRSLSCIAKWNGSSWSVLPSGLNSVVYALAVLGSDLYAGGWFTTAGGSAANYIAKWNGNNWSALGSGMDNYVQALAVSGSDLYAGGRFTTAGGSAANYIAKWNGSSWSALGSGMNNYVRALAVSGGDLYAGGDFTTAGGSTAMNIAKWNGSSWSAIGSGVNNSVRALAVSGSDLYAGGDFTTAGGKVSGYAARAYLERPYLSILRSNGSVTLSWPTFYAGSVLQQNPDVANPSSWSDANYPLTTNGAMKSATVPYTPTNRFFRLMGN